MIQKHINPIKEKTALAFDPSYINKSGKKTAGVGYFWSGVAGKSKWGLELGGIAVLDKEHNTAYHLSAFQTVDLLEDETLPQFYARQLMSNKEPLLSVSTYMVVDA